jgi:FKBP-type peptidyl-prolyl cis-trans isomerase
MLGILTCLAFLVASCSKDDNDDTADEAWKEQNEQAFNQKTYDPAFKRLTSQGNDGYVFYKQISPGDGRRVLYTDEVELYYKGSLINGEVFGQRDTTYDLPQLVSVSSANATYSTTSTDGAAYLMKGIEVVLQNMEEGEKGEVWIPQELGYGSTASAWTWAAPNDTIPAYSTLVFQLKVGKVTGIDSL